MLKVLIIDGSDAEHLGIAARLSELFTETSIINISGIEEAIKSIQEDKPDIVVVSLEIKDSKGKNLLERLRSWDFKIMIFQNHELYEIIGKSTQPHGYVFEKI